MNNTQIWEHISGKETIPSSWHHVLNIFCILDDFGASTLTKCHIESTYSAMHSPAELEAWRSLPQPLHTTPDLIKQLSLLNPGPIFRKFRDIGPRDKPRWAKGYFLWRLTPPDIENQTAPRSLTWHERNITRLVNQNLPNRVSQLAVTSWRNWKWSSHYKYNTMAHLSSLWSNDLF